MTVEITPSGRAAGRHCRRAACPLGWGFGLVRALSVLAAVGGGWSSVAAPVAAETPLPSHSTFQSPPPESAEVKPGLSVFGMKLPSLPAVKLPEMPSLPEMISTVGALPERVGLPNANTVIDAQFDKLVQKLNVAIPAVETLGYEVRNFEVDWTLPPLIKVRLQQSLEEVPDAVYDYVLSTVKGDLILESIVLSLNGVHKIQNAGNLAPFKRAVLEVDIGLPPHVIMTFSDPTNKFHDRFVAHHEAIRKALAERQATEAAKPANTAAAAGK